MNLGHFFAKKNSLWRLKSYFSGQNLAEFHPKEKHWSLLQAIQKCCLLLFVLSALSPIHLFCQKRWMMPRHILIACYAHFGPLIGTSCPLQSQNVHNRTPSVFGQHQNVFGHHQTHFGWANGQSRKTADSTTIKTQC